MKTEDRETLRSIASELRSYSGSTPELVSKLNYHAQALEALALEPVIGPPTVTSNKPRYRHDGPFGGGRGR
jgi:hypothetical protein